MSEKLSKFDPSSYDQPNYEADMALDDYVQRRIEQAKACGCHTHMLEARDWATWLGFSEIDEEVWQLILWGMGK